MARTSVPAAFSPRASKEPNAANYPMGLRVDSPQASLWMTAACAASEAENWPRHAQVPDHRTEMMNISV